MPSEHNHLLLLAILPLLLDTPALVVVEQLNARPMHTELIH
jgi:hypothetical protein